MNINEIISASTPTAGILITIGMALTIIIPIMLIIAIFNISSKANKLTQQMELLNRQMDYLLQLEEQKQGIDSNSGFENRN
jgi:hypothetical protein